MRVRLTDRANADLRAAYAYLAESNSIAAIRFVDRIDRAFRSLSEHPYAGRERPELQNGVRSLVCGWHVIFYVVQTGLILVIRVIDGRMDIDAEFQA